MLEVCNFVNRPCKAQGPTFRFANASNGIDQSLIFSRFLRLRSGECSRGLGCASMAAPRPSIPSPYLRFCALLSARSQSSCLPAKPTSQGPPWSNPGRSLVAQAAEPAEFPPLHPVALSAPRSSGAGPPVSCETGRAADGRAGSFNSGKNASNSIDHDVQPGVASLPVGCGHGAGGRLVRRFRLIISPISFTEYFENCCRRIHYWGPSTGCGVG